MPPLSATVVTTWARPGSGCARIAWWSCANRRHIAEGTHHYCRPATGLACVVVENLLTLARVVVEILGGGGHALQRTPTVSKAIRLLGVFSPSVVAVADGFLLDDVGRHFGRGQLHYERDLGVPIDVIDPRNYLLPKNPIPLPKEDEMLLNWQEGGISATGAPL